MSRELTANVTRTPSGGAAPQSLGDTLQPRTPEELAAVLGEAGRRRQTVTLAGNDTKRMMGGPAPHADVDVSTRAMNRVLQYEPRDLTISVEAGIAYAELSRVLAANNQMVPLDPPFAQSATIGGILASNGSGPRRRLYGTARDVVIGMKFATIEGKIVQSGGMVVKNVAGLDMGKLMIGSFGTLAAIAVANFKLAPRPALERTFLLSFDALEASLRARDWILRSVLQPASIDLLNPQASALLGLHGFTLALQFGGNAAVLARNERELQQAGGEISAVGGEDEARLWARIQDFTPEFLNRNPDGAVIRVSSTLSQMGDVVAALPGPVLARAGSGVTYGYFAETDAAAEWMALVAAKPWRAVVEFAPEHRKPELDSWPAPGDDFEMMKRVKHLFDPNNLLNRGRLYRNL